MQLRELAQKINCELAGDGSIEVTGVGTLEGATPGQVSFLANPKYLKQLESTQASAVIVSPRVQAAGVALLKAGDPYYAYQQALVLLHGFRRHPHAGVHPNAHVDPTAGVGEGSVLYPGVYVGPRARIGRDCILYPNAVVYDDCVLGDRVILQAGAVVGQDGFGYATHQGVHHKIPHIGNVVVEDDVEIGPNACIARAALGSTVIARGAKIDALVMIGHNVEVGEHNLLVAQVGIAGSTTLGHHVTLAGQVGVAGHVHIGDGATVGAQGGVTNDLPDQSLVMGSPAMPVSQGRRVYTIFTQLPELLQRIKHLEQRIAELGHAEEDRAS